MRATVVLAGMLVVAAAGAGLGKPAQAASVNIGVQTNSLSLGIQIGSPPPLVVVPGTPVYSAPSLPYNYFVYRKAYYLYQEGRWFRSRRYNGPWTAIAIAAVPRPILAIPVERYRNPPGHWVHHGPPPWAQERAHERGRGHGGERGRDRGRERGRGHD